MNDRILKMLLAELEMVAEMDDRARAHELGDELVGRALRLAGGRYAEIADVFERARTRWWYQ